MLEINQNMPSYCFHGRPAGNNSDLQVGLGENTSWANTSWDPGEPLPVKVYNIALDELTQKKTQYKSVVLSQVDNIVFDRGKTFKTCDSEVR